MADDRYTLKLDRRSCDLFQSALEHALQIKGFHPVAQLRLTQGTGIMQFKNNGDIVAVHASEKEGGNLELVVESERVEVEPLVVEAVEESVLKLLSVLTGPLSDEKRTSVLEWLRQHMGPPGRQAE